MLSKKQTATKNSSGRLRAHLLARYRTNISAEFHASQHARRDEIVGFVANLTLYVEVLKKSTVCLNECNIIFTVRIEWNSCIDLWLISTPKPLFIFFSWHWAEPLRHRQDNQHDYPSSHWNKRFPCPAALLSESTSTKWTWIYDTELSRRTARELRRYISINLRELKGERNDWLWLEIKERNVHRETWETDIA